MNVAFKTLGCRLNQAETAQIKAAFEAAGYDSVDFQSQADVYVIHSCTITKNAERKSVQSARAIKKKFPSATVVLAGCAVEADRENRLKKAGVDLLVNQKEKFRLPAILETAPGSTDSMAGGAPHQATVAPSFSTTRALVKIQDGCDFRCAYCIVPTARGNPVSRKHEEIIDEIKAIADKGFKEIILTGANLGCYNNEERTLLHLLESIEAIDSIKRIRLSSIEISTTERPIIDYMATSEKLCNYLHLPMQSGDDTILRAMGRRYSQAGYRDVVSYAVSKLSTPGIGADIIVGFPGESDELFKNTMKFVSELPLNNFHIFPYSPRQGTRAADMSDQVEKAVKKERCEALISLGNEKRKSFAESLIGKPVTFLVEKVTNDGFSTGWSDEYLEVKSSISGVKKNDIVDITPRSVENEILLDE